MHSKKNIILGKVNIIFFILFIIQLIFFNAFSQEDQLNEQYAELNILDKVSSKGSPSNDDTFSWGINSELAYADPNNASIVRGLEELSQFGVMGMPTASGREIKDAMNAGNNKVIQKNSPEKFNSSGGVKKPTCQILSLFTIVSSPLKLRKEIVSFE